MVQIDCQCLVLQAKSRPRVNVVVLIGRRYRYWPEESTHTSNSGAEQRQATDRDCELLFTQQ